MFFTSFAVFMRKLREENHIAAVQLPALFFRIQAANCSNKYKSTQWLNWMFPHIMKMYCDIKSDSIVKWILIFNAGINNKANSLVKGFYNGMHPVYSHVAGGYTSTKFPKMEWEKQHAEEPSGSSGGRMVMTDEQMGVLQKQIAAYTVLCEQLVQLYKPQTDLAGGVRLGNLYCDPFITSWPHKITGRQRWTPTPMQLQILEHLFDQGIGTPSKKKIKEITSELSQHGQVSETNVYNWFQNRRARSKRKQQATSAIKAESEVKMEVESPKEKKKMPEEFQPQQSRPGDLFFQNPQLSSTVHSADPREGCSKFTGDFGQAPFYGSMLSNPRMDQFIGKTEVPANYNPYLQQDGYNMDG